jgi:hypothetical protein
MGDGAVEVVDGAGVPAHAASTNRVRQLHLLMGKLLLLSPLEYGGARIRRKHNALDESLLGVRDSLRDEPFGKCSPTRQR